MEHQLEQNASTTGRSHRVVARRWGIGGVVAAAILVGATMPVVVDMQTVTPLALAHDAVLKSAPPDGGVVETFPKTIVLEFSGIPKPNFNTVALSRADTKEVLFTAEPDLDQQIATVTVPEDLDPGPGEYVVGFQITSSDGHATRGKTTFTVAGDGAEPSTDRGAGSSPSGASSSSSSDASGNASATPTATGGDDTSSTGEVAASDGEHGSSLGTVIGIAALVALIAGAIALFARRKKA